ncbi:gamma-glutamyl-gamma-aminobutyrate hydrolase family protein [Vibrio hepatarius]|uniref:gamma-glutamyl-gamma-aminobutyrate hydrolase family protein n=1 Tax=Vibrio hepatarius TaxID=171383 RepID=UPI001C0A3464|nr:gamma-glutamyl-gamma-aminobutyrate hydrolase family protein [Vibrio hepatarius]MBU2895095.1 gamma-glutamyl-gamma-aminobutyrate hydrolase family protein [Vibrio hepatarius]
MKFIGITQRVDVIQDCRERRDSLDQAWQGVCEKLNAVMIPLANDGTYIDPLLTRLSLDIVIFSGGNSLSFLCDQNSDIAPERDLFETKLLDYAIKNNIPVLGVCRGMQFINKFFGGKLKRVAEHVATNHSLVPCSEQNVELPRRVNSYHSWGIGYNDIASELMPLAKDYEDNIEAFIHLDLPILGIMWHPERHPLGDDLTFNLIKRYLF